MFWIFIAIVFGAAFFIKLGALSVLVTVLSSSLCIALLVIVGLAITLLWRRSRRPKLLKFDRS